MIFGHERFHRMLRTLSYIRDLHVHERFHHMLRTFSYIRDLHVRRLAHIGWYSNPPTRKTPKL